MVKLQELQQQELALLQMQMNSKAQVGAAGRPQFGGGCGGEAGAAGATSCRRIPRCVTALVRAICTSGSQQQCALLSVCLARSLRRPGSGCRMS